MHDSRVHIIIYRIIAPPCDCVAIVIMGRFHANHVVGVKASHYVIAISHIRGGGRTLLINVNLPEETMTA